MCPHFRANNRFITCVSFLTIFASCSTSAWEAPIIYLISSYALALHQTSLTYLTGHLYDEILLLDDGSVRDSVRKEAAKLLTQDRFKKVRGYRSEKVDGTSLSRFKASKVANGEILVFLSTKVSY